MRKKITTLEKRVIPKEDETIWAVPHFYLKGTPKPFFPLRKSRSRKRGRAERRASSSPSPWNAHEARNGRLPLVFNAV